MMRLALYAFLLAVVVHSVAAFSVPVSGPRPQSPYPYPYPCRVCTVNPCRFARCPRFPAAVCRPMPCTCQARFYLRTSYYGYYSYNRDVTALCYTRPPYVPGPYYMPGPVINPTKPMPMPGPSPAVGVPVVVNLPSHYLPVPPKYQLPMRPSSNETTEEPMASPSAEPEQPMKSPVPIPVSSPKPVEMESAQSTVVGSPSPYYGPYGCRRLCADTCRYTACPRFPRAVCHVTRCTCQPKWYFGGREVTTECFSLSYPGPYYLPGPKVGYLPVANKPMPSPSASPEEPTKSPTPTPTQSGVSAPSPYYPPYGCRRLCADTCRYTSCPRFPRAVCRMTRCTCQPKWYFGGREVTTECFTLSYPGPYYLPGPKLGYLPVANKPMPSPSASAEGPKKSPAPTPGSAVEVESMALCSSLKCDAGICKIDAVTGMPYCEPSCMVNNGGCRADEECLLRMVHCTRAPCPPMVECVVTK